MTTITTWFEQVAGLKPARLARLAREHAVAVALARDEPPSDQASDERLIVNWLRHEFTDYDADQSSERHTAACRAIAEAFPFLAGECERQIAERARRDAEQAEFIAACEQELAVRAEFTEKRRAQSREAINRFTPGQKVIVRKRGRDYEGTVVRLGKQRVRVEYRLKSGAIRSELFWAVDVQPLDAV